MAAVTWTTIQSSFSGRNILSPVPRVLLPASWIVGGASAYVTDFQFARGSVSGFNAGDLIIQLASGASGSGTPPGPELLAEVESGIQIIIATGTGSIIIDGITDPTEPYVFQLSAAHQAFMRDIPVNTSVTVTLAYPIVTDTDTIRILAAVPPRVPTGGENIANHLPAGWTRDALEPTTTRGVWEVSRTRTLAGNTFLYATAWGNRRQALEPVNPLYIKDSTGTLRTIKQTWIKQNGVLRPIRKIYIKQNGVLRTIG